MHFIAAYLEGFSKHYPEKDVKIKSRKQVDGTRKYAVIINGDNGGILLSESDMREATHIFNKMKENV